MITAVYRTTLVINATVFPVAIKEIIATMKVNK